MPFILGLSFAFLAILALAWPILRRRRSEAAPDAMRDDLQEAVRRRDRVYDDIKTLMLDHELGNVPDKEYAEKLAAFRIDAARAIRDLEQVRQSSLQVGDELEDEVLALRRSWGSVNDSASCEGCGREVAANSPICPRCELPMARLTGSEEDAPAEGEA